MTAIAEADPNFTLEQLNQFIAEREDNLLGPLTAIGSGNGKTRLTINDEDPAGAPASHSLVTLGAIPAGAAQIGVGQVFIAGNLTNAAAYRPA